MNIKSITGVIFIFFCHPSIMAVAAENELAWEVSEETRDVVYLKNGSIIRGTILEMIPDSTIRIQTGDGNVFVYLIQDVEKIIKENTQNMPVDPSPIEVESERRSLTTMGLLGGYGTEDGYNLGFGLRIGRTLSSGIYIGGTFIYHLGKSNDISLYGGFGESVRYSVTINTFYLGPEIGYEAHSAKNVTVRSYISCGYFSAMASLDGGGNVASDSESRFYIAPGITFNVLGSQPVMLGLDGRYVIVTGEGGSEVSAFGIFLTLGIIL